MLHSGFVQPGIWHPLAKYFAPPGIFLATQVSASVMNMKADFSFFFPCLPDAKWTVRSPASPGLSRRGTFWGSWVVDGLVVLVGFLLGVGLLGWRMFFRGWGFMV